MSSTKDSMSSLPCSTVAGTKRPAPSLLPAFEPSSSSPSLPRPPKRTRVSPTDDDKLHPCPRSDIPTSSTYIPSSSPPQLPNVRTTRPISSYSERAPLSAVRSIELDRHGEPTLMGRSSNSSHYQLSTNRLISRVHVRVVYLPADPPAPKKVLVECMGWNGVKIHCQGKAWELRKGDSFTSETEDAGIIVDVQDARVLLLWPRHENNISTPTDSDSAWDDENSPRRTNAAGRRSPFQSPLRQQHRLQSPISPSPAVQSASNLLPVPSLPNPIQVYEDEQPEDEVERGDYVAREATQSTQHASQPLGVRLEEPHSSPLSEPNHFSDGDEENDPIIHSFGPYGVNLMPRLEGFTTNSPERRRPLQPIKETTVSPQQRSSSETTREDTTNPVVNHVINQLAYSRVSSTPLSILMDNLPSHLKSVSPGSKENGGLTLEVLKKMLDATRCIGEVSREGKDAAGKPLQNEYYYIPDMDSEEKRRDTVVDGLRKPGLRACRKQHKVL